VFNHLETDAFPRGSLQGWSSDGYDSITERKQHSIAGTTDGEVAKPYSNEEISAAKGRLSTLYIVDDIIILTPVLLDLQPRWADPLLTPLHRIPPPAVSCSTSSSTPRLLPRRAPSSSPSPPRPSPPVPMTCISPTPSITCTGRTARCPAPSPDLSPDPSPSSPLGVSVPCRPCKRPTFGLPCSPVARYHGAYHQAFWTPRRGVWVDLSPRHLVFRR
jgi:hypothetical protein